MIKLNTSIVNRVRTADSSGQTDLRGVRLLPE